MVQGGQGDEEIAEEFEALASSSAPLLAPTAAPSNPSDDVTDAKLKEAKDAVSKGFQAWQRVFVDHSADLARFKSSTYPFDIFRFLTESCFWGVSSAHGLLWGNALAPGFGHVPRC